MRGKKYSKIIFADKDGTARAPMACEIFKNYRPDFKGQVQAKGVFVSFPEPINPKVEAVLASDGIIIKDFSSSKLLAFDIDENTLVLTVDSQTKMAIIESIKDANEENIRTLRGFAGEELEVMNPYGGSLQTYGICYESMKNIIKRLIEVLEKGGML